MPPILKATIILVVFIPPIFIMIYWLLNYKKRKIKKNFNKLANDLGIEFPKRTINRIFQFPSLMGVIDGYPIWVGTTAGKHKDNTNENYSQLQVVVGRKSGGNTSKIGSHHINKKARKSVPYRKIKKILKDAPIGSALLQAECDIMDGGQTIEVFKDVLARTFSTSEITSKMWVRLTKASVITMVAYVKHTEIN